MGAPADPWANRAPAAGRRDARNTGTPGEFATVRADVPAGAAHITLGGVRWALEQFHWHTPSEHEIEGRDTPLEMHLVHTRADGALVVIAGFIERGRENDAIERMFGDLPDQLSLSA
jgi:carbonic anhydrase